MESNSKTEKLILDDEKNLFELKENKNISDFENSNINKSFYKKINVLIYQFILRSGCF